MGSPKVTAFPWHALPRLSGRSVEARRRLVAAFDFAALPRVVREVTQLRVEDSSFTPISKQAEVSGFGRCLFRGPDFVLVVFLEPALVVRGLAAALGVEPRLDLNTPLSDSLQAALQAAVQVVTRRVARAGCLPVLNEAETPELTLEPDWQTDFEVRVQGERYWGRLAGYIVGAPHDAKAVRDEVTLNKLRVRLVAIAGVCRLRHAEVELLELGDCVVVDDLSDQSGWVSEEPLEALWLTGIGSERALLVRNQAGAYLLEEVVSLPQIDAAPGSDDELYARVTIEAGSLALPVKQWRTLTPGDAVPGLVATSEACVLRVGERALAQGFIRRLGNARVFCVSARL